MEVEEVQPRILSVTPLPTISTSESRESLIYITIFTVLGEENARDETHTYRSCLRACTSHFQQDKLAAIVGQRLTNHAKENFQQNNNRCRQLIFGAKPSVDTTSFFLAILPCADAESRL